MDYTYFLFVQLTNTLTKANELLSSITLDDFVGDNIVDDTTENATDMLDAIDSFTKVIECRKLISHANDLADVLVDSVAE